MVSSRKRGHQDDMEDEEPVEQESTLHRIRNMWEFANLNQWIFFFGKAVKIDENLDIETLEMECLKCGSTVLPDIGLALLKFVSSHRGLTPEIFDEYTRRQYVAKAPHRNPYGIEEEPAQFIAFDIFTKIRVLQQLTQWTLTNPDRIRERMIDHKDTDQASWRIESFGWDARDRTYFLLDDDRLYRLTDAPPPPPPSKPKKNTKKSKAALRASKRRKLSESAESEVETTAAPGSAPKEDDGLGGAKWECLAVSVEELNKFIRSIEKTRDPNQKNLYQRINKELLPIFEKREESEQRKIAQKERELLNIEKMATAKRSSRIATKLEQQKQEEETREAEEKHRQDLANARHEVERQARLEKERDFRMMTREQRLREREARRILQEEELASLSEDSKIVNSGAARISARQLKAEKDKKQQELNELVEEAVDDDWEFDCICGARGEYDGTHSIACEECKVWQHSKCVGISASEADREDYHFICKTCKRRAAEADRPKPTIKIKFNRPESLSSTRASETASVPSLFVQSGHINQDSKKVPQMHLFQTNGSSGRSHDSPAASTLPSKNQVQSPQQTNTAYMSNPWVGSRTSEASNAFTNGYSSVYASRHGSTSSPAKAFTPPPQSDPQQAPAQTLINGYTTPYAQPYTTDKQAVPNSQANTGASSFHNAQHSSFSTEGPRRSRINHSSPTMGGPILTPQNDGHASMRYQPQSPSDHAEQIVGSPRPTQAQNQAASPLVSVSVAGDHSKEIIHTSALPPASTGISPVKHSPPQLPSATNGHIASATPSMIPPVAPLSPSPQYQNLSPPVKASPPIPQHPHVSAAFASN